MDGVTVSAKEVGARVVKNEESRTCIKWRAAGEFSSCDMWKWKPGPAGSVNWPKKTFNSVVLSAQSAHVFMVRFGAWTMNTGNEGRGLESRR